MRQGVGDRTRGADAGLRRDHLTRFDGLVDAIFAAQTRLRRRLGRVLTDCIVASICACTEAFNSSSVCGSSSLLGGMTVAALA